MMTLSELLAEMYRDTNNVSSPATSVTDRFTSYLNQAVQRALSRPGFARLLYAEAPFSSVADQSDYALPAAFARIFAFRDTANQYNLVEVTEGYYRDVLPTPTQQTGTPTSYARLGSGPVALAPSAPDSIFVVSDDAADTRTVQFRVLLSNGRIASGSVLLTGNVAVTLAASLTTIVQVVDFWVTTTSATATITMTQGSGAGAQLSAIYPGHTREYFQRIALIPTPQEALSYVINGELEVQAMTVATDEPPLPPRFHRALVYGALMDEWGFKTDDGERLAYASRMWEQALADMNAYIVSGLKQTYIPGRKTATPSNLPAWYPMSTYRGGVGLP